MVEIILTERSYIRDLEVVNDVFIEPIRAKELLSKYEISSIFANIQDLLPMHWNLLNALLSSLEADPADRAIGRIFLDHLTAVSKEYGTYISNRHNAERVLLAHKRSNKQFAAFLEECQLNASCRKLALQSFLAAPFQRITRYPLLLRLLVNTTKAGHPDFPNVLAAIDSFSQIVSATESKTQKAESIQRLMEVHAAIDWHSVPIPKDWTLVTASRRLLFEGPLLRRREGRKPQEVTVFLFNDVIIITRPRKDKLELVAAPISLRDVLVHDGSRQGGTSSELLPNGGLVSQSSSTSLSASATPSSGSPTSSSTNSTPPASPKTAAAKISATFRRHSFRNFVKMGGGASGGTVGPQTMHKSPSRDRELATIFTGATSSTLKTIHRRSAGSPVDLAPIALTAAEQADFDAAIAPADAGSPQSVSRTSSVGNGDYRKTRSDSTDSSGAGSHSKETSTSTENMGDERSPGLLGQSVSDPTGSCVPLSTAAKALVLPSLNEQTVLCLAGNTPDEVTAMSNQDQGGDDTPPRFRTESLPEKRKGAVKRWTSEVSSLTAKPTLRQRLLSSNKPAPTTRGVFQLVHVGCAIHEFEAASEFDKTNWIKHIEVAFNSIFSQRRPQSGFDTSRALSASRESLNQSLASTSASTLPELQDQPASPSSSTGSHSVSHTMKPSRSVTGLAQHATSNDAADSPIGRRAASIDNLAS
ncbi:hypothetical protein, variant [Capsaspora owczarzaki ATCC 30864]|nr:hypothetical protein, variant [Capsaspora owczarzaki ATCC 30864]